MTLKMKKPTVCCCFTWIVFTELNLTVAFLLIRKTWDDRFDRKIRKSQQGIGIIKKLYKHLPRDTVLTIYKSLMRPHLDYCVIVYYIINLKMTDLLANVNNSNIMLH